jgi:hypothetical protein
MTILEQGVRGGEALAGQPGGIDQVAVNPFGRLVDELQDGAFIVETNVSTSTPMLLP